MKLTFVAHASVIVTTDDAVIWSDPWLFGRVFNESWSLSPAACFDNSWLNLIDYIWISHEHPDHFHIPTLKSLPDFFKEKVTILFQKNNSNKLTDALQKLGYKKFIRLPHRKFVKISLKTTIFNYQVGLMDSILGICSNNEVVLNLNDAQININDIKLITKKLNKIDVVLNQFSMAGYNGQSDYEKRLFSLGQSHLEKVYSAHIALNAKKTIPFASMIFFSAKDNKYVNEYINTPQSVCTYFEMKNYNDAVVVMYPGDEYIIGSPHDNSLAIEKYNNNFNEMNLIPCLQPDIISSEKLIDSFKRLHDVISKRYYKLLIMLLLKPMRIYVPDLKETFIFHLAKGEFYKIDSNDYDLAIYSQPLYFAMQFDWGFQTLGVSARHVVVDNYSNYKRHRILFSLNNAEVWLKLHLLFKSRNLIWMIKRFEGLLRQIKYRYLRQSE